VIFQRSPSLAIVTVPFGALDLDLRHLVAIESDDALVAQDREVLRHRRPRLVGDQQHRRLARPHGVDALLGRVGAPDQQGLRRAVLLAPRLDVEAYRLVEAERLQ
jgi:hypothetical protein